jgi:hypothetical protein
MRDRQIVDDEIDGEELAPCGMLLADARRLHQNKDLAEVCGCCLKKSGFAADYQATVKLPSFSEVAVRLSALQIQAGLLGYEPNRIKLLGPSGEELLLIFDSDNGGWQGALADL